jgi:transcriptional regulator with XRE-family HTH domain
MAIPEEHKSHIRLDVSRAVRRLRQRLAATQAELAEMVGSQVSMLTVSRWERGELPYPKNRRRLADIAVDHGWWDIAAAMNVELQFDQWLSVLESNLPEEYTRWMALSLCALNAPMFEPENPQDPTDDGVQLYGKYKTFVETASDLLQYLVERHNEGKDITVPPNAHYRRFWWEILDRRSNHGSA